MHLPYKDVYFTPQCWEKFKQMGNTSNWMFTDLPFLKDGDFIATETYPISLYLINKANRKDLLGKTLEDEAKVDIFLWQCQILN
jgi:glutathione S-transferase